MLNKSGSFPIMPRKPGPQLTRDQVVQAAAEVLQRNGYDGLTMRAVAGELGVQAPALYWHVRSKEDLALLLFDHLIDDLDYGAPTDDWRADARRMTEALRKRLVETRDITRLFPGALGAGPRAVRSLELGLGLMRRAGLPPAEAFHAYGAALSFVVGWARFEVTRRASAERLAEATPKFPPAEIFPNIAWLAAGDAEFDDIDAGFRFGVELLIAGVEQRIAVVRT